jgi:hypothetical protein
MIRKVHTASLVEQFEQGKIVQGANFGERVGVRFDFG